MKTTDTNKFKFTVNVRCIILSYMKRFTLLTNWMHSYDLLINNYGYITLCFT